MLFIKQCNKLHEVLPELFEATNDYTELLLSLSFTDKDGVVYHLVNDIPEDDFNISEQGQVEIIGWMYQYYNTEPKDKVFEGLKKNVKITKENIPAATQLFTPDWIVRYMIENSLGRLWTEGHPDSSLREEWKYYLDEAQQEPEVQAQLDEIRKEYKNLSPEDIKVIDPCMGSGHILVYAFDVLMQIYTEQGYTERDAAKLIVEKNLWGLDIDKRAYQLAYFAVMMKARQYNRRILTSGVKPNLFVIDDSRALTPDIIAYIADGDKKIAADLCSIKSDFDNAREYGSIINVSPVDFDGLLVRLGEVAESDELNIIAMENKRVVVEKITPLVRQAQALAQKYDVVCTNPPYMGGSGMSAKLSDFVKTNYPDSKSDLFAVFIEKCGQMAHENGYQAMITQHAWMFLSSYEKLREKLMFCISVNMAHLGARAFDEIGGEVVQTTAFVEHITHICGYKGTYSRLVDIVGENEKRDKYLTHTKEYVACQDNFSKIPGAPVAYWVSDNFIKAILSDKFEKEISLVEGIHSRNNDAFLRLWYEVGANKSSLYSFEPQKKWFPYSKGGNFRLWYGNNEYLINWENNGLEVKRFPKSSVGKTVHYFEEGITFTIVTSARNSFRYVPSGFLYDVSGPTMYVSKDLLLYTLGLVNTKIVYHILRIYNPTISIQIGDIKKLPLIKDINKKHQIDKIVQENITLSKSDWDSFETSWDFKKHPLLENGSACGYAGEDLDQKFTVESCFSSWEYICNWRFNTLKQNEEELNRIFIDIYGLQDELTPEVEEKDVTVRRADLTRDIKSLISYAVGCMFGRYSLNVDGLAYAGGEWDDSKYRTFIPDDDNCIPITDEEYFKDDIVVRFVEFIRTVYGSDTLEQNLNYIADALGTKGNTSRERIRNYFLGDFIKDHIKTYQKRPIYWLFDSGKKNGFKALVYAPLERRHHRKCAC